MTCKARVLLFPLHELAEHHSHVMYPPLLRTFSLLSALPLLHSSPVAQGKDRTAVTNNA